MNRFSALSVLAAILLVSLVGVSHAQEINPDMIGQPCPTGDVIELAPEATAEANAMVLNFEDVEFFATTVVWQNEDGSSVNSFTSIRGGHGQHVLVRVGFSWSDFPTAYLAEKEITFDGEFGYLSRYHLPANTMGGEVTVEIIDVKTGERKFAVSHVKPLETVTFGDERQKLAAEFRNARYNGTLGCSSLTIIHANQDTKLPEAKSLQFVGHPASLEPSFWVNETFGSWDELFNWGGLVADRSILGIVLIHQDEDDMPDAVMQVIASSITTPVAVPTAFVWSDGDVFKSVVVVENMLPIESGSMLTDFYGDSTPINLIGWELTSSGSKWCSPTIELLRQPDEVWVEYWEHRFIARLIARVVVLESPPTEAAIAATCP
jgi:hypothetical protein